MVKNKSISKIVKLYKVEDIKFYHSIRSLLLIPPPQKKTFMHENHINCGFNIENTYGLVISMASTCDFHFIL